MDPASNYISAKEHITRTTNVLVEAQRHIGTCEEVLRRYPDAVLLTAHEVR